MELEFLFLQHHQSSLRIVLNVSQINVKIDDMKSSEKMPMLWLEAEVPLACGQIYYVSHDNFLSYVYQKFSKNWLMYLKHALLTF